MDQALILQSGKTELVFGLEWFALLDGSPAGAARRIARRRRATHMVVAGQTGGAVGVVALPLPNTNPHARRLWGDAAARKPSRPAPHSAAMLFARHFASGTVAALIDVLPGLTWLVAVHEGVVVARTDSLYRDGGAALAAMAELKLAYPHIRVAGQDATVPIPSLDALSQHADERSLLLSLSRWRQRILSARFGLAMALVLVFCVSRFSPGSHAGSHPADAHSRALMHTSLDHEAIEAVQTVVHGATGLRSLLGIFHELPFRPGGWLLEEARCKAQALQWHCSARYRRHGVQATNEAFLQHAFPAWTVSFVSLDEASVEWVSDAPGVALRQTRPLSTTHNDRHLLSALQGLQTAFSHLKVGQPEPLAYPPALGASPVLTDNHARHYQRRAINAAGPLRSASLLVDHAVFMAWSDAMLRIQAVDAPDVRHSSLFLTLEGNLYESVSSVEKHQENSVERD